MNRVAASLAAAVVFAAVAWLALRAIGTHAAATTETAWDGVVPRAELARRFPRVETVNASAVRLDELTRGIGVVMAPRNRAEAIAERDSEAELEPVKRDLTDWVNAGIESPLDSVSEPPATLARYLEKHRAGIDAIVEHLRAADAPRWPTETIPGPAQPLPNLGSHMKLLRVLAASALDAERRGDHERAWRCEEASWKLVSGVTTRPELISQLIGVAGARIIAGVARKLEPPEPAWFAEFASFDFRASMLASMRVELQMVDEITRSGSPFRDAMEDARQGHAMGGAWSAVRDAVMRPYYRWSAAVVWASVLDDVRAAADADPCTEPQVAKGGAIVDRVPAIARPMLVSIPALVSAVRRASVVELEIEGSVVIQRRKSLRAADGSWPAAVDPAESRLCHGAAWSFAAGPPATVRFSAKPAIPKGFKGPRLPVEFVFE